jgi:hypothetical protein
LGRQGIKTSSCKAEQGFFASLHLFFLAVSRVVSPRVDKGQVGASSGKKLLRLVSGEEKTK